VPLALIVISCPVDSGSNANDVSRESSFTMESAETAVMDSTDWPHTVQEMQVANAENHLFAHKEFQILMDLNVTAIKKHESLATDAALMARLQHVSNVMQHPRRVLSSTANAKRIVRKPPTISTVSVLTKEIRVRASRSENMAPMA